MTEPEPPQSISAFARGDRGRARALTQSLQVLHDKEQDPAVRRALEDVLDGRVTLREFLRTPAGASILHRGAVAFENKWSTLSEEEKDALAEQGNERLAELRDRPPTHESR